MRGSIAPQPPPTYCDIAFVGASRSGKTALVERFMHRTFSTAYDPTTLDTHVAQLRDAGRHLIGSSNGPLCDLRITDTCGLQTSDAVNMMPVQQADVVFIVYDSTDRKSFREAERLMCLLRPAGRATPSPPTVASVVVLVGTKGDRVGAAASSSSSSVVVPVKDGLAVAARHGAMFFGGVSAATSSDDAEAIIAAGVRAYLDAFDPLEPWKRSSVGALKLPQLHSTSSRHEGGNLRP